MKRLSPDAGRRRTRRRHEGVAPEVVPLYAASVFAAATLAFATFVAPDAMRTTARAMPIDACHPVATTDRIDDDARG
jgi:hypothetical protein